MRANLVITNLGKLVVVVLSLLPVWLWWLAPVSSSRFAGQTNSLISFGQLFGLVGLSMLALNLVLSARFKFLEKFFKGLNELYDWHRRFGQISFILLLFHPIFLLTKYASDFRAATFFLLPVNGLAQNLGWISLAAMLALIILTLYLRPRYHIWKLSHKLFGVAFLLGGAHSLLMPSDVSVYKPLQAYLLLLISLGLIAFIYRSLLRPWTVKTYLYSVSRIKSLNDQVIEISMTPHGAKMSFIPGQFIFVSFQNQMVGREVHPFSLTSLPGSSDIIINVKQLGDYTQRLTGLRVGDRVNIEGPFGIFNYERGRYKEQIWVAGGIGITPFMSMARSLSTHDDYHIDLYYCTNHRHEMIHLSELQNISPRLHIIPYSTKTSGGYLTADKIERISGSLKNKSLYICAPLAMITSLKRQLRQRGISRHLVHSEEFNLG